MGNLGHQYGEQRVLNVGPRKEDGLLGLRREG